MMKDDLKKWDKNVIYSRKRLYSLNYFTCMQLLNISRELSHMADNPQCVISKETFLLLMSISPNLTVADIEYFVSSNDVKSILKKGISLQNPTDGDDTELYIHDLDDVEGAVEILNEEKKKLYYQLKNVMKFDSRVVLTALRKHGTDKKAAEWWCVEHEKYFDNSSASFSVKVNKPEISVKHPTVAHLIQTGYPRHAAIKAVQKHGRDVKSCMDFCNTLNLHTNSSENCIDEQSCEEGDNVSEVSWSTR